MKQNARLLAILLALALTLSAVPVFAGDEATGQPMEQELPAGIEYEVPDGDLIEEGTEAYLSYAIYRNDDGQDTCTLVLGPGSRSGLVYFYGYDVYTKYKSKITQAIVSEGVTGLAKYCLYSCENLKSVSLPSTLNEIGIGAFALCRCLNDFDYPADLCVNSIGSEAFLHCGSNPKDIVTKLSALDGFVLARACYAFGSLPPGVEESDEAKDAHLKAVYDEVTRLRMELGLEEMSDIQKVKHIYDWITENVDYDYDALGYEPGTARYNYAGCAHSALFEHRAICAGYADAARWLLNESGIDCVEIDGPTTEGDHAWLLVCLDGKWYAMDPTWDTDWGAHTYYYFLKSQKDFDIDPADADVCHYWDTYTGIFSETYPISMENYGEFSSGDYKYVYYGPDYVAIRAYTGTGGTLTLPQTVQYNGETVAVTALGKNVFSENGKIKSVVIPEGYTEIGMNAFSTCLNLKTLQLPSTLKRAFLYSLPDINSKTAVTFNGTMAQLEEVDAETSGLFERAVKCSDGTFRHPKSLSFAKVTLSKKLFTYNGSVQKPAITVTLPDGTVLTEDEDYECVIESDNYQTPKNVDDYYVYVYGLGNYFSDTGAGFTIRPQATALKPLTPKSKSFTARWTKKTTQVTGYQLQYATNKSFTKGRKTITIKGNKNISKTVKKLKGRKIFYVRIRTYKYISSGEYRIYSAWSSVRRVKTKR